MDIQTLVAELTKERDRIERAIAALSDIGPSARRPGRPVGSGKAAGRPKTRRRHMSPAARKRISEMMKKRWAERKRKAKAA
jgi:hypothetical protein